MRIERVIDLPRIIVGDALVDPVLVEGWLDPVLRLTDFTDVRLSTEEVPGGTRGTSTRVIGRGRAARPAIRERDRADLADPARPAREPAARASHGLAGRAERPGPQPPRELDSSDAIAHLVAPGAEQRAPPCGIRARRRGPRAGRACGADARRRPDRTQPSPAPRGPQRRGRRRPRAARRGPRHPVDQDHVEGLGARQDHRTHRPDDARGRGHARQGPVAGGEGADAGRLGSHRAARRRRLRVRRHGPGCGRRARRRARRTATTGWSQRRGRRHGVPERTRQPPRSSSPTRRMPSPTGPTRSTW